MPVHQIHRLARAVGGVDRGEPAVGALSPRRKRPVPQLGDHRAAVGAPGVEDRVGPPNRIRTCEVFAQQRTGAPARRLAAGGSINALMPARAMPVITALWCGPTRHWTGS
jgi:hypothetical protein